MLQRTAPRACSTPWFPSSNSLGRRSDPSWFAFLLTMKEEAGLTRDAAVRHLESNGIQTRPIFAGNILRHPCMDGVEHRAVGELENTDYVMNNSFLVGVHPGLTLEQLGYMADHIMQFDRRCNAGPERVHSFV